MKLKEKLTAALQREGISLDCDYLLWLVEDRVNSLYLPPGNYKLILIDNDKIKLSVCLDLNENILISKICINDKFNSIFYSINV